MLFAHDKSQTCNNILQFAHVYAWAREHGRTAFSMRFSYKYQYFHICKTAHASFFLYLLAKYAAALRLLPTASFKRRDCDREALERKMLRHRHIVVSGWYVRYYDLFMKYRDEICGLFAIDDKYTRPVDDRLAQDAPDGNAVRLGVHIRRGDYATWCNGAFYYDNEVYARHIRRFHELHRDEGELLVYLCSNDPEVCAEAFGRLCPGIRIFHLNGSMPEDLHLLSRCDYLIGPPSTFTIVASMYHDTPYYRMASRNEQDMTPEGFHRFEYWLRRTNEL